MEFLKKLGILTGVILIYTISAAIYGAIHNQFSYSISTEYFTKFKFSQFGFVEYGRDTPRLTAGAIGAWASYWVGFISGVVVGLVGLFSRSAQVMWKTTIGAWKRIFQSQFVVL